MTANTHDELTERLFAQFEAQLADLPARPSSVHTTPWDSEAGEWEDHDVEVEVLIEEPVAGYEALHKFEKAGYVAVAELGYEAESPTITGSQRGITMKYEMSATEEADVV